MTHGTYAVREEDRLSNQASRYADGEYLRLNPSWGIEDARFKVREILKILGGNAITARRVADVGCGAGELLRLLHQKMGQNVEFEGFEVSPQAFELCMDRASDRLRFHLEDFSKSDRSGYDLLLCIDVIEHVEDVFGFLRRLKEKAQHKVFDIALEISVLSSLREASLVESWRTVGHIHKFSQATALEALVYAGYKIVDHHITCRALATKNPRLRTMVANIPRRLVGIASKQWASKLFGGYSLMVLAQ